MRGLCVAKLTREGELKGDGKVGLMKGCSPVSASLGGDHFLPTLSLPPPGCLWGRGRRGQRWRRSSGFSFTNSIKVFSLQMTRRPGLSDLGLQSQQSSWRH